MSGLRIRRANWERERELLLSIRFEVFVEEQGVPAEQVFI